jgi:hypothetical protein
MQTSPSPSVRRLLFPSIAAAGLVFIVSLTVMGSQKSAWFERVARVRAEDNQRAYALTNNGRDNAIRVVGLAIVLSVGTGIVTVELLRKWYGFQERVDLKAEEMGLNEILDPAVNKAPFNPDFNRNRSEDRSQDRSQGQAANRSSERPFDRVTDPETLTDAAVWGDQEPIPVTIQLVPGTYTIDRQVLPGTLHSQLVLHYEGQLYRFLRTAETTELLWRYCQALDRALRSIVVTPLVAESESGYGIWEQVS